MIDKRRNTRVKDELSLSVSYYGSTGAGKKALRVLSKDISASGVKIRTPDFVPVGTELNLELILPEPRKILETRGICRWIQEAGGVAMYELGVEFQNLSRDDAAALGEYVNRKTNQ